MIELLMVAAAAFAAVVAVISAATVIEMTWLCAVLEKIGRTPVSGEQPKEEK